MCSYYSEKNAAAINFFFIGNRQMKQNEDVIFFHSVSNMFRDVFFANLI